MLELLVTLAIAAILISVGVPGFRNVIMDNRLVNHANQFVTSVNLARSAAVRYQRNATICTSTNYDAAVPTCGGGSDWSRGWIVWVDKDRDDATDANEIISVTAADNMALCDGRAAETGRLIKVNNVGRTSVSRNTCS